jgi:hypothetical protein
MAFLRYDISIVGQEKVRAFLRATEAEVMASNRRTSSRLGLSASGAPRRSTANSDLRSANENASSKAAEAIYRRETAALDREERKRTSNAEREAKKRTATEDRESKKRVASYVREFKRGASVEAAIDKRSRLEHSRLVKGVLGGTASRVASVGRTGVAMAGLGGGALVAAGIHGAAAKSAAAADLANQLLGNNATKAGLASKRDEILATVGATKGFAAPEVISGMSKFQGVAGEGAATMKMAPILTQTSLATGASMEDLGDMYASMYAAIRNSSGGAKKSVDEIIAEVESLGRVFGAMGQVGAIEIKDVASVGSEITAAAMSYAGDIKDNIQKVGAMMQVAKQTGGAGGMGGAEASTAAQNFANDLVQKKDEANKYLQEVGGPNASIFSDKSNTKLKSLDVLLPELMAATGGDLTKMGDILNIRGTRGLKGFTEPYHEAYTKAKSEKKSDKEARELGKKAVSARFAQFAGIEQTKEEVREKAAFRLAESDKLLEENTRLLTSAIGKELLPELTKMIPAIAKLVPAATEAARALVGLTRFFASNPFAGLAGIVGLALTTELAKAGIASVIKDAITGGTGTGASGLLGKAATTIAIGVATFSVANAVLNILGQERSATAENASKRLSDIESEYGSKRNEIMSGPGTAIEKVTALKQLNETTSKNVELTRSTLDTGLGGAMTGMPDWFRGIFDSATATSTQKGADEFQKQLFTDLKGAIDRLASSVSANPSGAAVNTSNAPTVPVK